MLYKQITKATNKKIHDDLHSMRERLSGEDLKLTWHIATAEAKEIDHFFVLFFFFAFQDGDVEAARRENRAWRLMGMETL